MDMDIEKQHVVENKASAEAAWASTAPFVASADPNAIGGWQVTQGGVMLQRNIHTQDQAANIAKRYNAWRAAVNAQQAPVVDAESKRQADEAAQHQNVGDEAYRTVENRDARTINEPVFRNEPVAQKPDLVPVD